VTGDQNTLLTHRASNIRYPRRECNRIYLELSFEQVARSPTVHDIDAVLNAAEDQERRVFIEELVEWVTVFSDHLEVKVSATPPLNVLFNEVGLTGSDFVDVGGGGPTYTICRWRLKLMLRSNQ
jgi:hypothetical protein